MVEEEAWEFPPLTMERQAACKSCSISFGFQVPEVWMGASTLSCGSERCPRPQLHRILLGWLTRLAQGIGWKKTNLLFQRFL